MKDIYRINDWDGNKIGLIKVTAGLDIIDVTNRVKNKWGDAANWSSLVFLGTI